MSVGRHEAGGSLRGRLEAAELAPRAVLPESLYAGMDHSRIDLLELVVSKAQAVHDTLGEILQDDVGPLDKGHQDFVAPFGLQVQGNAALVVVEDGEVDGILVVPMGELPASAVSAFRVLDLENVRAQEPQ